MLRIYTNVVTNKHFDANGDLFADDMPKIFYKSTEVVMWQLCSETPDIVEGSGNTPENFWTKYTGYAQFPIVGAILSADDDYIKRVRGTLSSALSSGTISEISATISGADFTVIPPIGVVSLFDSSGGSETVRYNSRTIANGVVTFTLASGSSITQSYDSGATMDASQECLMQASLDGNISDVQNGLFGFKIVAYSNKLHDMAAYSNRKSIDVMGLELAVFTIDQNTNAITDRERYELDTMSIQTGMAETHANVPVTPSESNEIVTVCNTLLAAGFSVQFSSDGENWHDTQVTTGTSIDVYFRYRSAASGGTWSNGIRLVKGDKGDDGASAFVYIRYASDNQGTGFSATPSDSLTYIGVLATTTAIATPQASDFTGLWVKFQGPQGNPGASGQRGTRTNFGTSVTGTSTTPAVFATGISDSLAGDLYLNTSTFNLYSCAVGGDAATATWGYLGSLKGPTGDSRYVYQGFASSSSGADFSTTPSASLPYTAFIITSTALNPPTSTDFASATWLKYLGSDGTSSYTYVAYASDSSGSNFSNIPSDSLKYRAEIHVSSPITTPTSSNFSGATWQKFLGNDGTNGTRGSRFNYGTAVTGTSSTPTAFATGISDSLAGDAYINTSTQALYRCTLGGNASTALWAYVGSMKGDDANAPIDTVKLNGEELPIESKAVNVKALALVSELPALAETEQDYVLFGGTNDLTTNPPSLKGHVYFRNGSWSDSSITVKWGNDTQTLLKVGTSNAWTDTGGPGADDYGLSWSSGHWNYWAGGTGTLISPSCQNTVMPWELSGQPWEWDGEDTTVNLIVKRSYSGNWLDLTAQGDSDGTVPLSYATTMPSASKNAKDFVLFLGTTDANNTMGHLYKNTMTMASSLTVTLNGSTVTLNKQSGNSWQDTSGDYSLYYSSTRWYYNNDGWIWKSPTCPNTTMPWEFSGVPWTDEDDYEMTPTISDPTSYAWTDLGAMLATS